MDQYLDDYIKQYKDCAFLSFTELEEFMKKSLIAVGISEDDAAIISDVLIESDKRGIDSHGIGRLKPIYIDRIDEGIINPITEVVVLKDKGATALLDASNGMGHVVSYRAMKMAMEKAKKFGIGMVAVRNSNHYGIAGYYTTMAAKEDMIGITGTNARPSIAPTFGVENMMGTNPLTFSIPTNDPFPFTLDCATSVSQRGKIEVYGRAGKELPPGWVIDLEGKTRTDTDQVLKDLTTGKAALTPLGGIGEVGGGYKGYGYAAVVEILSSALQNGKFMKELSGLDEDGNKVPYELGHFFIAIDPSFFSGIEIFKAISTAICKELRESKKAPGEERIYTAGEKEYLAEQARNKYGCPVPTSLQKVMLELNERFNLGYTWSFS